MQALARQSGLQDFITEFVSGVATQAKDVKGSVPVQTEENRASRMTVEKLQRELTQANEAHHLTTLQLETQKVELEKALDALSVAESRLAAREPSNLSETPAAHVVTVSQFEARKVELDKALNDLSAAKILAARDASDIAENLEAHHLMVLQVDAQKAELDKALNALSVVEMRLAAKQASDLKGSHEAHAATYSQLEAQKGELGKALDALARAEMRLGAKEASDVISKRNTKLEQDVQSLQKQLEKEKLVSTNSEEKLTLQLAKYGQLWNEKQKALVEQQEALAEKAKLKQQKDSLWTDLLKAKADLNQKKTDDSQWYQRCLANIKAKTAIANLSNRTSECRNCGYDIDWYVELDNRSELQDRELMLRCGNCRCRHFTEY